MMSHLRSLELESPVFSEGFPIPKDYTADGSNSSPPLRWSDPPEGTVSFALICDDPDAPHGVFTHWLLFNLPADQRELPPGVSPVPDLPHGTRQGTNDFGRVGYSGPSPPPGNPHRYFFKLYALVIKLSLTASATREDVLTAMQDHKLAEGKLFGVYGRSEKGR